MVAPSTLKEKVKNLLASGLSAAEVARATGVDASYVSQLLSNKEFKDEVTNLAVARQQSFSDLDALYDKMEKTAMERLSERVEGGLLNFKELVTVVNLTNTAKRRLPDPLAQADKAIQANYNTVVLHLPQNIPNLQLVKNSANEVLELNSKTLLPMDSSKLANLLEDSSSKVDKQETGKEPVGGKNLSLTLDDI